MKNILYVDDDEQNLFSLKSNLRGMCNIYTTSNNDIDFIMDMIKKYNINDVILDERMPNITGREIIDKLCNIFPNINYSITSAFLSDNDIKSSLDTNVSYFFSKPWDIDDIINKVVHINKKIVLITSNTMYSKNISNILKNKIKNSTITCFSRNDDYIKFLTENTVDLIIIDDNDLKSNSVEAIREFQQLSTIYVLTYETSINFYSKYINIIKLIDGHLSKANAFDVNSSIFH